MEAPTGLTAELKEDQSGQPYFELRLNVPEKVKNLAAKLADDGNYFDGKYCEELVVAFDYKYGDYDWNEAPTMYWDTSSYLVTFRNRIL